MFCGVSGIASLLRRRQTIDYTNGRFAGLYGLERQLNQFLFQKEAAKAFENKVHPETLFLPISSNFHPKQLKNIIWPNNLFLTLGYEF